MSGIGGKLALEARNQAVGMLLAGASQQAVAQRFSVTVRTVQRWWRRSKTCDSLSRQEKIWKTKEALKSLKNRSGKVFNQKKTVNAKTSS